MYVRGMSGTAVPEESRRLEPITPPTTPAIASTRPLPAWLLERDTDTEPEGTGGPGPPNHQAA